MRKDLPPVKYPTGQEVRAKIVTFDGKTEYLLVSNEVNGKFHVKSPVKEFWIEITEYEDIHHILKGEDNA